MDVDAVMKEKAARERERRREASEKAKRKMREEHARIERDIEKRLKGKGTERVVQSMRRPSRRRVRGARESVTKIHRREEKEGEKGRMKEEKGNRRIPEEKISFDSNRKRRS